MSTRKQIEHRMAKHVSEIFHELLKTVDKQSKEQIALMDRTIWQLRVLKNQLFRIITEDTSPEEVKNILEKVIEDEVVKIKLQKSIFMSENIPEL